MVRALLRLILVVVVLVAAAAFFLGWWGGGRIHPADRRSSTIGTAGHVDTSKAERVGAQVGEKTAQAANRAAEIVSDGALTAKIKSKMALDDTVRSRSVDVSTTDHVVTLSGTVRSQAEHDRIVQLARETSGVTQVIDHLNVAR
jgi:hyperosmotically inducible periplasmic protein